MIPIPIRTETIRLSQFLKLAAAVRDGVEAKVRIQAGLVMVNGAQETRRGGPARRKSLYSNDLGRLSFPT